MAAEKRIEFFRDALTICAKFGRSPEWAEREKERSVIPKSYFL